MDSFLADGGATHPLHFAYAVYFAFVFVAARFFFDKFVFRRLAKWMFSEGSDVIMDEVTRAKIGKCSESMWKLTYYATVEACILHFTYREPWFTNTKEYFKGWPNQVVIRLSKERLRLPLKLYYMCQCGFYLYSIAALLVWETRRKDFAVMMSHHVITVILIGYSYIARFTRIGSIVLALHDASDVFMEAAKVFKYSEHELAASICFGFFAISWLILRLVFFPFWVIKTSSYDFQYHLNLWEPYPKSLYYVFNTMLLMLLVFHIYWWLLICAMIIKQLKNKGKVGEDIRSDSEDDE
ncbi:hypothetical protein V2J09_008900 [Rumex salicifolius]